ncbi:hypothetical protein FVEN_g278 [Fusarium venenatum]|uniref:uncharacterized protein n=1 Tax=Fusarium venenatum TaxID=56646 RepID=UPI001D31B7FE|nr:hypothetical protein FVEN_g278 [Fusarium venenatum]KAH6994518.1 hypothetical protein EDB82DRAFT_567314 [Fusarium venenatum]
MATSPNTHEVTSPGSLSEAAPPDGAPGQDAVPTPAPVESPPSLHSEGETSSKVLDSMSSTKLFIAAQVLEQEAKKLQSLCPDPATEDHNDRLDLAIRVLEEVRKELHDRNNASQQNAENEAGDNSETPTEDEEDKIICKVKRLSMEGWSDNQPEPKHAIAAYYPAASLVEITHDENKAIRDVPDRQERPHRVELASLSLLQEITEITGIDCDDETFLLLAPPYKLLIRYHDEIGERLVHLEGVLRSEVEGPDHTNAPGSPKCTTPDTSVMSEQQSPESLKESSSKSEDERDPENKKDNGEALKTRKKLTRRFDSLKLLQDFSDKYLAAQHMTYARIKSGDLEKITFEDLCFLFTVGDIIYIKEREYEQLGKTYAVSGGQQRKEKSKKRLRTFSAIDFDKMPEGNPQSSARGLWSPLTIDYYTMESDGYYLGSKAKRKEIKHFSGERSITDLAVFPLRFHQRKEEVVERLTERGTRYHLSHGHKSYRGMTCSQHDEETPNEVFGDIYVDFKDYYRSFDRRPHFLPGTLPRHNPHFLPPGTSARPNLGILNAFEPDLAESQDDVDGVILDLFDREIDQKAMEDFVSTHQHEIGLERLSSDPLSNEVLQLLPHWVPAYFFRTRTYHRVYVSQIEEIDKSDIARDNSFESLVIPDGHRKLLVGLVRNLVIEQDPESNRQDNSKTATQIDIVRGKGQGLIILLHGPPGSGKTSTAETLAAYSRRPLYPITCGDLGVDPDSVERSLNEHTERAQRWGCILLLDEADVFLSRRDWRDTNRNALVSVFLRQLEYYSGILFLTTNRVGVIDEAFKSRIHVSLAYPTIRLKETLEIWEGILDRLTRDNHTTKIKVKFDRSALLTWADRHYRAHEPMNTAWNGRQIRNAFQLAISLGHHDRDRNLAAANMTNAEAVASGEKKWTIVKLTTANFNNIAKTARDFEDYLHATRGDDSEIAKTLALRHDEQSDNVAGYSRSTPAQKDYPGRRRELLSPRLTNRDRGISRNSSGYESRRSRVRRKEESPSERRQQRRSQGGRDEKRNDEFEDGEGDENDIIDEFSSDDE